jgi:hypothetical protein
MKMTPEQFSKKVEKILATKPKGTDEAQQHMKTDELMEELLISLGYREGVKKIQDSMRWYE